MKKSLFITIAILVIASVLCFAAFANEEKDISSIASNSNSASIDVYAKNTTEAVYFITVDFDDMYFEYSCNLDPEAESGESILSETWSSEDNKIIVTNKSNVSVNILFNFELAENIDSDITATFIKGEEADDGYIATTNTYGNSGAVLKRYSENTEDCKLCALLNLSGNADELDTKNETKIGTVTVTASAVE